MGANCHLQIGGGSNCGDLIYPQFRYGPEAVPLSPVSITWRFAFVVEAGAEVTA